MAANDNLLCEWAQLYVLDGLDPEDRQRFEAHLATCVQCQREVRHWTATVQDALLTAPDDHDPPAGMKDRVLKAVFADPLAADLSSGTVSSRPARRGWAWGAVAVAAALLLFAAGYDHLRLTRQLAGAEAKIKALGTVQAVVALASPDGRASGQAFIIETRNHQRMLVVSGQGLPRLTQTEVFQVWWVRSEGVESAGTFVTQEDGQAYFAALMPNDASIQAVAVTLEPDAYGRQPRGAKVLVGALNKS